MKDTEHAFNTAIFVLDHTAERVTAEEALNAFGDMTQESFWRMWPDIRAWGEALWHDIEEERGHRSVPADEEDDHAELGGG